MRESDTALAYYISVMSPLRINQSCWSGIIKKKTINTCKTVSTSICHSGLIERGCQMLRDTVLESTGSDMRSLIYRTAPYRAREMSSKSNSAWFLRWFVKDDSNLCKQMNF